MKKIAAMAGFVALGLSALGQCDEGQMEVSLLMDTDAWGYEMYWELVPSGNGCGNGTLFSNGNPDVGCFNEGGGTGDTYANNALISEGPFCLNLGDTLDLIYVDSYGDGGLQVSLFMESVFSGSWSGTGDGNTWTFVVGESLLIDHDTPCAALPVEVDGPPAVIANNGGTVEPGEPTPGPAPTGSCALPGSWCSSDGNASVSVWLSFEATSNSPVVISSCNEGTNFDTQLAVYRTDDCGTFSGFELIASNDDAPGGCGEANGYSSVLRTSCLEAGVTYFIQLDGWAGGQGTAHVTVNESSEEQELGLMAQIRNVSCPADKDTQPDGILAAYVSEGVSDFAIGWTGPNGFMGETPFLENLSPGLYTAQVTTACGNSFENSWEISLPSAWSVVSSVVDASCVEASNGAISLEVTGATGPYEYTWNGPGVDGVQGPDLDSLQAGTYQIEIEDDNSCTYPISVIVEGASTEDFTIGPDSTICDDQAFLLYAPAGYDYTWQDGSANQFYYVEPGDLAPGTYSFVVNASDDAGCVFADAMILTVFNCITNVEGVQEEAEPMLFPNPAHDWLSLRQVPVDALHQIRDAQGRVVWTGRGPLSGLSISNWSSGRYFWSGVSPAGERWNKPFAVAH